MGRQDLYPVGCLASSRVECFQYIIKSGCWEVYLCNERVDVDGAGRFSKPLGSPLFWCGGGGGDGLAGWLVLDGRGTHSNAHGYRSSGCGIDINGGAEKCNDEK
jgi:hypothetical protein